MLSYLRLLVPRRMETPVKRSNPTVQRDLFSSVPAPPAVASLQLQHDELVELLSRLIWEVASSIDQTITESRDEQDQS